MILAAILLAQVATATPTHGLIILPTRGPTAAPTTPTPIPVLVCCAVTALECDCGVYTAEQCTSAAVGGHVVLSCGTPSPTPTPTGTIRPTPTPIPSVTPVGPQPVGRDTLGTNTCFHDESGKQITSLAPGFWYCPAGNINPWLIASSVEPDDNPTPGIGTLVPLGYSTKAITSQPFGAYGLWQMNLNVDTINNPCPVTCDGWLWGFVGDDDPGDHPVSDDLTAYLNASWKPHGKGMARLIAQFTFSQPNSSHWAELDVNLGMTPNWPRWAAAIPPGYVSVAPVGSYSSIGLMYYVVFDGPALGFVDALTTFGVPVWRIPVSALVRKARADYPAQFPVGEDWTLSAFGIAREQNGEEAQDIWIQEPPKMWMHGPQTLPQ